MNSTAAVNLVFAAEKNSAMEDWALLRNVMGRCHGVLCRCDDLRKRTLDGREYGVHAVAEPLTLGVEQNDDGDGWAAMAAMMIPMGFAVIAALSAFCAPVATAVTFAHPACASWDTVTWLRKESHEDFVQLEGAIKGRLCDVGIFGTHRKQLALHLRHLKSVDDGLDTLPGLERHKDCRRCDQLIPEPGHGVEGGQHLVGEVCRDLNRGCQKAIDQSRDERRGLPDALGD